MSETKPDTVTVLIPGGPVVDLAFLRAVLAEAVARGIIEAAK